MIANGGVWPGLDSAYASVSLHGFCGLVGASQLLNSLNWEQHPVSGFSGTEKDPHTS